MLQEQSGIVITNSICNGLQVVYITDVVEYFIFNFINK